MKRILVLSSFPAPYRVNVFMGLSEYFELDVFFAFDKDQNRSKEFFLGKEVFKYHIISNDEDFRYLKECITNLPNYDIVLAYDWYLKFALKIELKCIKMGIPYIVNCDGAFIDNKAKFKNFIKDSIKSFFIRHARLCFASGLHSFNYFRYHGAKSDKIRIHHFSSLFERDIRTIPASFLEKEKLKIELDLKPHKMVLAIGQFIKRKGFDVLLEAWQQFDDENQLVIIGGGELKSEYQKIIDKKNYRNVILIDFVHKEKVFEYYSAATLFVLPTNEDIWGLVVNESLAVGVPVVSTNRCVAAMELIRDGENGYIVPAGDVVQLRLAIKKVLELPNEKLFEFGKNGISSLNEYTIENIVKNHYKDIMSVLETRLTN